MNDPSRRLKNQLRDEEADPLDRYLDRAEKQHFSKQPKKNGRFRSLLALAVVLIMGFFVIQNSGIGSISPVTMFTGATATTAAPSESLLQRMGDRMEEMGYTGLSHDDLRELRSDGVTATYISNVRALGYSDLTLGQSVSLAKANASSAFIAMMIELGYTLSVEDIITLRNAGVTAHYTSNLHDMGYRDVTIEQLIRMKRIGVTPELIEQLRSERGDDLPLEEVIRYRISNQ